MGKKLKKLSAPKTSKKVSTMQKTVLVTLFFGLPGLGKTTFWHELKKLRNDTEINVEYFLEDKI